MKTENIVLTWDIPTRMFHWLLACGFTVATLMALLFDEHRTMSHPRYVGVILTCMVVLQVILGFTGTRHARFNSFIFSPRPVLKYITTSIIGAETEYHTGHNSGSAYAVFALLLLIVGLSISGIMIGQGADIFAEVHEFLTCTMFGVAFVRIVGAWSCELISYYDASSQTTQIPILGIQLTPGEPGENDKKEHSEKHDRED